MSDVSQVKLTKKTFSLQPDEPMRWIYDHRHPDYDSDMAKDLRQRRAQALRNCPRWLLDEATDSTSVSRRYRHE